MKGLRADFAAPWRPGRRAWATTLAISVVAVLAWGDAYRRDQGLSEMRGELARLKEDADPVHSAVGSPLVATPVYAANARAFLALRSPDWTFALDALEAVPENADVQLQELQVLVATGELRARVSANGYPALLDWLSVMNAGSADMPGAWRWTLLSAEKDAARGGLSAQVRADQQREPPAGLASNTFRDTGR